MPTCTRPCSKRTRHHPAVATRTPPHTHTCTKTPPAGRLATIRGTVVRMSHIRPLIVEMDFSCQKCFAAQHAVFPDGRFTPPTRCVGDGCRGRTFVPDRATAKWVALCNGAVLSTYAWRMYCTARTVPAV